MSNALKKSTCSYSDKKEVLKIFLKIRTDTHFTSLYLKYIQDI